MRALYFSLLALALCVTGIPAEVEDQEAYRETLRSVMLQFAESADAFFDLSNGPTPLNQLSGKVSQKWKGLDRDSFRAFVSGKLRDTQRAVSLSHGHEGDTLIFRPHGRLRDWPGRLEVYLLYDKNGSVRLVGSSVVSGVNSEEEKAAQPGATDNPEDAQ